MDGRSLILSVVAAVSLGSSAWGQAADPNHYGYADRARPYLFSGTISGMTVAYQILNGGVNDPAMTGDRREMLFLHALAHTGMLVFDRSNLAADPSLVEILETLGVVVTGDTLFHGRGFAPDGVYVDLAYSPVDGNCPQVPRNADVEAAKEAVNTTILPGIDQVLAELALITDMPTAFGLELTPSETGLASPVEVDYGDVLWFKAMLLTAKAFLYGVANPAHDLTVDLDDPLFAGWRCGWWPEETTLKAILEAYPTLLETLPEVGPARLEQAKQEVVAALDAALAALDYAMAETDDQQDDLLGLDADDPRAATIRSELDTLRTSLVNGAPATYTFESEQTFSLSRDQQAVGQIHLTYNLLVGEGRGWMELPDSNDLPAQWQIGWMEISDTRIYGDAEAWADNAMWWGWFEGNVSPDGSQITDLTFSYWAPTGHESAAISGLTAQRTSDEPIPVQFDPNPLLAGAVSPRDMLPRLDANSVPVAGTFGHALGNDATFGGIFPDATQDDWLRNGYEVYGVPDPNALMAVEGEYEVLEFLWHVDQHPELITKLGESAGGTATFAGDYPMYIVAVRSRLLIDSIYGTDHAYADANSLLGGFNIPLFEYDFYQAPEFISPETMIGPPDGRCAAVGEIGLLRSFTGWVVIANPGSWTSLTVVTQLDRLPVYRFWSPVHSRHFYTISEDERQSLVDNYPHVWTYEGIVYHALPEAGEPNSLPVYRFWSDSLSAHFYTISEAEKELLTQNPDSVWRLEGIAFYAYPEGAQPESTTAVYRFWSNTIGCHFYTASEAERDLLLNDPAQTWTYEGIAWYAYP